MIRDETAPRATPENIDAALRGLRAINRLIISERDPEALLRGAAAALVEARGFSAVCLARVEGDVLMQLAIAGDPALSDALASSPSGLPECLRLAIAEGAAVVRGAGHPACDGCALVELLPQEQAVVALPIQHAGERLGGLLAVTAPGAERLDDEVALLGELAADLGIGLHGLARDAALRESEGRLRLLTERVTDVLWVYDLSAARFAHVSPSIERLRGFTAQEVLGETLLAAVTEPSRGHLLRVLPGRLEAFERGREETHVDELEQPCKDGTTVWVEMSTRLVRDESTGHVLVYGTSRDITDRRRAEQALRERLALQEQLAGIAQSAPGLIHSYRIRPDGTACMPFSTPAIVDVLGVTQDEAARADTWMVNIHAADRARSAEAVQAAARALAPWHDTWRYQHPTKGLRWLEGWSVPRPDSDGGIDWHGFIMDVTDRRQAEVALTDAEERQRLALDAADLGTFRHDLVTNRVELDERACRHLGIEHRSHDIVDFFTRFEPDAVARLLDARDRALAPDGDGRSEVTHLVTLPNGERRWLSLYFKLSFVGEGEACRPVASFGVVRDITQQKQAEDALRALTAELEQRVAERTAELARAARAKDDFLASMSHELRTPLNGVLGTCEVIAEGVYGPVSDTQRAALGRVGESGRHLLALINDILDVAKIEAGKLDLDLAPVAIGEVCRAGLRLVQEPARRKGLTIATTVDPALPLVFADERRLKQVLVNLLTNAVKFTPDGGQIGVDAALSRDQSALDLVVWDSGVGIAAADVPRLFQPFVQLDSSLARQHSGTGLGLALVRRLVEQHGGSVAVESEPGRGARFTVKLPLRRAGASHPARVSSAVPPSAAPITAPARHVLIADDDETNTLTLVDFLGVHGWVVHVAR